MTVPAPSAVPVTLDLREYLGATPVGAEGYIALWLRLEPAVIGVDPRTGPRIRLALGAEGEAGVWFLDPMAAPDRLTAATPFALRGVLERPQVFYACDTCKAAGATVYGPFTCTGCGDGDRPGRVCDTHATFLEGSLRASCPRHVPACSSCGETARAWCGGPGCRSGRAWCRRHLAAHPADAVVEYCQGCYDERFPACEQPSCRATGHGRCEYRTFGTDRACRKRMCAEHSSRWQIYGSASRGLVLCAAHRSALKSAAPETLTELILAGTAARSRGRGGTPQRPGGRRQAFLPRLSIVRHIFINTCDRRMDMSSLDALFTALRRQAAGDPDRRLAEAAQRLLDDHAPSRREDVRRFDVAHDEGRVHLARLVALLREKGRGQIADAVGFSDYRPAKRILFVLLPAELRGRFIGTGRANVRELEQRLGISIQLERE